MEKFGIFELLDTLSALSSAREEPDSAQPNPSADQPPLQKADVNDRAFAPPPVSAAPYEPQAAPSQADAFAALISRHENISKKIDERKKT